MLIIETSHLGGVKWCIDGARMLTNAKRKTRSLKGRNKSPRTSVTFPPDLYQTLEQLAGRKKVSVAWIVRDAAERYVEEQWPLFAKSRA
jgi:predicted DNA-binding ribbon-helix-helix protein